MIWSINMGGVLVFWIVGVVVLLGVAWLVPTRGEKRLMGIWTEGQR